MSMILKSPNYNFQTKDLILITADRLNGRRKGVRVHSTTIYYWNSIWQNRDRQVLGVIRNGLFMYVEQLTKKSV